MKYTELREGQIIVEKKGSGFSRKSIYLGKSPNHPSVIGGEVGLKRTLAIVRAAQGIPRENRQKDKSKDSFYRYFEIAKQKSELGIYINAVLQLQQNLLDSEYPIKLSGKEKESLLFFSLYANDSMRAVLLAESVGISHKKMIEQIDDVSFDMSLEGEELLKIVKELKNNIEGKKEEDIFEKNTINSIDDRALSDNEPKPKATSTDRALVQPSILLTQENKAVKNSDDSSEKKEEIREQDKKKACKRKVKTISRASQVEKPIRNSQAELYDHPFLTSHQENILLAYMRNGHSLDRLKRDKVFRSEMKPKDIEKFERILNQSSEVGDIFTACNMRLVAAIAGKVFLGQAIPLEDRIQAGQIGLLKALRKWDPAKGAKFSTYAVWDVRSSIQRAVIKHDLIQIPAYIYEALTKVSRVERALIATNGREPTSDELRQQLIVNTTLTLGTIQRAIEVKETKLRNIWSLNHKKSSDNKGEIIDTVEEERVDVEEEIARNEIRLQIRKAIDSLPTSEREIIEAFYGIDSGEERDAAGVAKKMGITLGEVKRLHNQASIRLSNSLKHLRNSPGEGKGKMSTPDNVEGEVVGAGKYNTSRIDPEYQRFLENIQELRGQGLEYQKIAEMLGVTSRKVNEAVQELIVLGKVQRRNTGQDQEQATVLEAVLHYRQQGFKGREISDKLGVPYGSVRTYLWRLGRCGAIKSKKDVKETKFYMIKKHIITAYNAGLTYAQIAVGNHITASEVDMYIGRLKKSGELKNRMVRDLTSDQREKLRTESTEAVRKFLAKNPGKTYEDGFREIFNISGTVNKDGVISAFQYRKREEVILLDTYVKEMLAEGMSKSAIAAELSISASSVGSSVNRLIMLGVYNPHTSEINETSPIVHSGGKLGEEEIDKSTGQALKSSKVLVPESTVETVPLSTSVVKIGDKESDPLYLRVRYLRRTGSGNKEIAEKLRLPIHRIAMIAHELIKSGEIEPLKKRKKI